MSVEGIWQGLNVFENADVDTSKFYVNNMKGIKRSMRKNGRGLGHRRGANGNKLFFYVDARREIYLPSYRWILENCLKAEIIALRCRGLGKDVVLLDYETNAHGAQIN